MPKAAAPAGRGPAVDRATARRGLPPHDLHTRRRTPSFALSGARRLASGVWWRAAGWRGCRDRRRVRAPLDRAVDLALPRMRRRGLTRCSGCSPRPCSPRTHGRGRPLTPGRLSLRGLACRLEVRVRDVATELSASRGCRPSPGMGRAGRRRATTERRAVSVTPDEPNIGVLTGPPSAATMPHVSSRSKM